MAAFGGLSVLMMLFAFREPKREAVNLTIKEKLVRMDLIGTVLFISAIVCLFLGLEWGGNEVPWSDSKAWGLLLGFGLLMSAFIALQLHMGEEYASLRLSTPLSRLYPTKTLQCNYSSQNFPQPERRSGHNDRNPYAARDKHTHFLPPLLLSIRKRPLSSRIRSQTPSLSA